MFRSNWGLTLNLEIQYPTAALISVSAVLDSMSFLVGGLSVSRLSKASAVHVESDPNPILMV